MKKKTTTSPTPGGPKSEEVTRSWRATIDVIFGNVLHMNPIRSPT